MKSKFIAIILFLTFILSTPVSVSAKEYNNNIVSDNITIVDQMNIGFDNTIMFADDYEFNEEDWNLCTNPNARKVFKFIGNILKVAFIAIPILLIVMGSIDFMKAVVAGKEDDIKKCQSTFIKRILAAVIVFLVPLITSIVMGILTDKTEITESTCLTCLLDPSSCN